MLSAAFALISCAPFRKGVRVPPAEEPIDAEAGARLLRDLERIGARVYSQEGIPMLLACQNLEPGARRLPGSRMGAAFAARFRRLAETYARVHPKPDERDAAKIIELLAAQDLAAGGRVVPHET